MTLKCKQIVEHIEKFCPRELAFEWDNVGLLVGDWEQDIRRVLVALDATEEVIEEAIHSKIDMIVTHHPLFIPKLNLSLKSITTDSILGILIYKLIKNNISLYCAHTNLDIAKGGVNDVLAELFELGNVRPLEVTGFKKLKKLVVFVPEDYVDKVREAMSRAGAGWIGNYSDCSFMSEGVGTFRPLEGTNPFIGITGKLEKVKEYRLETIVEEDRQNQVVKAMLEAHPYEEVAYDIYHLENKGKIYGIGRIGELKEQVDLFDFIKVVKHKLGISTVRLVGDVKMKVKKVAVCSGGGMSMLDSAIASGADVYITGDAKYHDAQKALAEGIAVIDAGHYYTEHVIIPVLKKYIEELNNIEVIESKVDSNPFKVL